ncbi:CopG family transcriptional regulator [Anabaena lutea]|uniref:CopG family transcriptional regulator n=1 Tax=Anabaena lutea FACHB-196 TaxID=2692881 RepID=A0ABR8FHQ8_9NOST|nr:CopG family transcriptional regulator [Anabaena lutea]MBD2569508.1 CopG family transcriptional regulator [Anabaena lutea FACHB-196]
MPKPEIYMTLRLTQPQQDLLREYCQQTGRNQTDVLQELVRG